MQIRRALALPVTLSRSPSRAGAAETSRTRRTLSCASRSTKILASLDPALAGEPDSGNVVLNLLDPLVRLNDDLEPEAGAGGELGGERRTARP